MPQKYGEWIYVKNNYMKALNDRLMACMKLISTNMVITLNFILRVVAIFLYPHTNNFTIRASKRKGVTDMKLIKKLIITILTILWLILWYVMKIFGK